LSLQRAVASFNPADCGTPETDWQSLLDSAPSLALPSCPILIVSPHPDDEVLGAGGLIHCAALAGHAVTVLSVTDGEQAYPDWQGLARIRRRELSDALSVLAPSGVSHECLGFPDGELDRERTALFDAIDRRLSPAALLVAPYERDGHPDHEATAEVCCAIAKLRGLRVWRYPIWAWHHARPEDFDARPLGRFLLDAEAVGAKAQALSCFTSQLRPWGRAPIIPAHVLRYFARPYEAFLV
jgi:LmbE family N-acetylglucosaminyl deacetylase